MLPLLSFLCSTLFIEICENGTDQEIIGAISRIVDIDEGLRITIERGKTEATKALIDAGADVNDKDDIGGWTALIRAAREGYAEAIKVLLDTGADVNAKNNSGNTALMWAAYEGRAEALKILLNARADVNAKDDKGDTALINGDCTMNCVRGKYTGGKHNGRSQTGKTQD